MFFFLLDNFLCTKSETYYLFCILYNFFQTNLFFTNILHTFYATELLLIILNSHFFKKKGKHFSYNF